MLKSFRKELKGFKLIHAKPAQIYKTHTDAQNN